MTLIEWRKEFELGIEDVDHEHRELVALINALEERMRAAGANDASVGEFLGELHARIAAHFALEERVMREHDYDELADHKSDHERLLDDIRDLMDLHDDGQMPDVDAFAKRLEAWFSEHFRTRDARLHRHLG